MFYSALSLIWKSSDLATCKCHESWPLRGHWVLSSPLAIYTSVARTESQPVTCLLNRMPQSDLVNQCFHMPHACSMYRSYADMHWYALICCQYIVDTANLEQNPGGTALLSCPLNVTLLPRCPEHESHIPTFELDSFGSRCRLANPPTRELPQPFTWKPTFLKSEKSDLQIVSWNSNDSSLNQKWYANGVWLLFDVDAIAGTSLWFL